MAGLSFKAVTAYLKDQDIDFDVANDESSIRVTYRLENMDSLAIIVFFDEEYDSRISLRAFEFVKFPESKFNAMYKLCSDMNKRYRYIKFAVDEEARYVELSTDVIVQLDTCGETIEDLMFLMFHIADDAYPDFMRALFSR